MVKLSPYFTSADLINSLRKYYDKNEQYNVNFNYWLNTAKKTREGIIIKIRTREFLIDYFTGSVIREL